MGGLTTRQIAQAYLVPECTTAQRISRAKRLIARAGLDRLGDVRTVMRILYLGFNEGCSGDVDLSAEAIRLIRQLAALVDDPEAPESGGEEPWAARQLSLISDVAVRHNIDCLSGEAKHPRSSATSALRLPKAAIGPRSCQSRAAVAGAWSWLVK
jgi:hypothetical protein